MNPVVHFEMPYDIRERMAKFYELSGSVIVFAICAGTALLQRFFASSAMFSTTSKP
jgi:hypothetical protein